MERLRQLYKKLDGNDFQTPISCRAYLGKLDLNQSIITDEDNKRILEEKKLSGEKISINKNGKVEDPYISCNHCIHYSPKTLEGRKKIAELIANRYRSLYENEKSEVDRLDEIIKKNVALKL